MRNILEVHGLKHRYGSNSDTIVFPDFSIVESEHLLVLGGSGNGKSTLLHLVSGLLQVQEGRISVNNTHLNEMTKESLAKWRRSNIGIVHQRHHFVQSLTARENLEYTSHFTGTRLNFDKLDTILSSLGIRDLLDKKTYQLSEGQKQRLSLVRAVLNSPELLLCDEPTSALDDENTEIVAEMLKSLSSDMACTLFIVTHDSRLRKHFEQSLELKSS